MGVREVDVWRARSKREVVETGEGEEGGVGVRVLWCDRQGLV